MTTLNYRAPRLSRAKALIGAMAATLALSGAVQVAAPVSAPAKPPLYAEYCMDIWSSLVNAQENRNKVLEEFYAKLMTTERCWGAINGL